MGSRGGRKSRHHAILAHAKHHRDDAAAEGNVDRQMMWARPRRKLVIIIGQCLICLRSNLILDCRGHMRACARNKDIQCALTSDSF